MQDVSCPKHECCDKEAPRESNFHCSASNGLGLSSRYAFCSRRVYRILNGGTSVCLGADLPYFPRMSTHSNAKHAYFRFVGAFTSSGNTPVLIRSYTHDTAVEPLSITGCTIWQAARATSAAATFFDPIKIGLQKYLDGATGMNNPVEYVFEEVKSIWPDAVSRIRCLSSVGTGVPDLKDFGENMKEVIDTLKAISTQTK